MISLRRRLRRHFKLIILAVMVSMLLYYFYYNVVQHESNIGAKYDNRTTYVCIDKKCITKMSLQRKNVKMISFQSMESCRLTCGEYGNFWPLPITVYELGKHLIPMDPNNMILNVEGSDAVQSYLFDAFRIFRHNLITECGKRSITPTAAVKVVIDINEERVDLDSKTSEIYELSVSHIADQLKVSITADTAFGARHGLETAAQLTSREFQSSTCSVFMLNYAHIKDSPYYKHRGILIDTSRQFIPVKDLERTISAMAANKLNVLHWHATDTHSFPLQLKSMPQLTSYGAYSAEKVYTEDIIVHLVEYAKLRGVRILMELDIPARTGSGWQFGRKQKMGNLTLCWSQSPWTSWCLQPPCGQLNPYNKYIHEVLNVIFKDLQNLIPGDDMFHMGGSEVYFPCWTSSRQFTDTEQWKDRHKNETIAFYLCWNEFHGYALDDWDTAIGHLSTKIVLWSSSIASPRMIRKMVFPNKRYIIQTTASTSDSSVMHLIELGYELIYSSKDAWYLDHGFDGKSHYHDWKKVYDNNIPTHASVLGGEVLLWTDYADSNSLDNRLWPRASALAERLWSFPATGKDYATYRLAEMRERLIRRGIKVDQIMSHWCYLNEGSCNK